MPIGWSSRTIIMPSLLGLGATLADLPGLTWEGIAVRRSGNGEKRSVRVEEARAAFAADYATYQYRFVEFFLEHLSDVSRTFKGDLQAAMVLALVGQMQLWATRAGTVIGRGPGGTAVDRLGITASRIADITGIPRETARRKLEALRRRGWVLRNPDGSWRLNVVDGVAAARTDLAEIDDRGVERVARFYRDLESLVLAHASAPRPAPESDAGAQNGQVLTPVRAKAGG